jgi:hypothetical protein
VKAHTGLQISFLTDDDLHRRPVAGYLAGATRAPRHGMPPSWGPLAGFSGWRVSVASHPKAKTRLRPCDHLANTKSQVLGPNLET